MTINFTTHPPSAPAHPQITFASQKDLYVLGQMLSMHRGIATPEHRLQGLVYSFLIYDHYATAYRLARKGSETAGESWRILAMYRPISEIYALMLTANDEIRLGDTELHLPIEPASPFHAQPAPLGAKSVWYKLQRLTASQFVEIAWIVNCNLLHGTWNPGDAATWQVVSQIARPMMRLVWEMLATTTP